jgi:hypothetical protein
MGKALPQNVPQWLVSIVIALITAGAGLWGGLSLNESNEKKSEIDLQGVYLKSIIEEAGKLREINAAKDSQISDLQIQVTNLQNQVESLRKEIKVFELTRGPTDSAQILETIMDAMPYPMWIHEVGENNWFINQSYSDRFQVRRTAFWSPINIFSRYPVKLATEYVGHDMDVIKSGNPNVFDELIPEKILEPIGKNNPGHRWKVLKYPITAGGRKYVWGSAWSEGVSSELLRKYE